MLARFQVYATSGILIFIYSKKNYLKCCSIQDLLISLVYSFQNRAAIGLDVYQAIQDLNQGSSGENPENIIMVIGDQKGIIRFRILDPPW